MARVRGLDDAQPSLSSTTPLPQYGKRQLAGQPSPSTRLPSSHSSPGSTSPSPQVASGWQSVEQPTDPSDGCNAACVRDRLVFMTDEPLAPPGFGSLFVADNLCRKAAKDHGYSNFDAFKAWLSDDDEAPANRFFRSTGRYVQVTGDVVAESWDDLVDGELAHGIDRTIAGVLRYEYSVWTSTQPTGEAWGDSLDCLSWTTSWPEEFARQGISGFTDTRWTDDGVLSVCGLGGRLYCFEQ